MDINRQKEILEFLKQIKQVTSSSDFQSILASSETVLGLTDDEFARKLKVSRPTINRWRSGKNVPHELARPNILKLLKSIADEQINNEEKDNGHRATKTSIGDGQDG